LAKEVEIETNRSRLEIMEEKMLTYNFQYHQFEKGGTSQAKELPQE